MKIPSVTRVVRSVKRSAKPPAPATETQDPVGVWAHEMIVAALNFGGNVSIAAIRRTGLTPEHLAEIDFKCAAVLRAALAVIDRDEHVGPLTVYRELQDRDEAEKVELEFLVEIPEGMPLHDANVQYHAARVLIVVENRRKARRLRDAADALARGADQPLEARDRALKLLRGEDAA
jgi:hypothetical protein